MSLWPSIPANDTAPDATGAHTLPLDIANHRYVAIAVAVAIVTASTFIRFVFLGQLETRVAFLTFYPAVALAALYGGLWPGVIATLLSALLADYFWIPPGGVFAVPAPVDQLALAVFIVSGLIVSWTAELSKRGYRAARRTEASRREEVERLVLRRTSQLVETTNELHAEMSVRRGLEERFRAVIEAAPTAMIMIDGQGAIELVNFQAEQVFGYFRGELIGRSIDLLLPERFRGAHGDDRAAFLAAPAQRAMGAGRDLFGLRKDGGEFPLEIGLSPLQTPEGLKVISSIVDISKRRGLERAQSESEERMRLMLDSIQDHAIVMLDTEGRVVSWNAGAERLKGYNKEEILGRHFSLFHLPEDVAAGKPERELIVAAAEGRAEDEGRRRRKDGSLYIASVIINAVRDPRGELRGFVKVTRDITERKRIENQLIEANRRFALAAGAARLGFWELDIQTLLLSWDDQMFDLYGVPAQEGPQPNVIWTDRLHPDDRAEAMERVRLAKEEGHDFEIEYRIVRPDGGVRHVRSVATAERDAAGRATRLFGVNFDITERQRIESQLVEANERFALAAQAAGIGFYDLDVETRTSRWDDQMFRLYGVSPESGEEAYEVWRRSLHPDDRAAAEQRLGEAMTRSGGHDYEVRIVRPDGGLRHIKGAATAKQDPTTGHRRMFGLNFDITERKQIEIELMESNKRFAIAAEAGALGFWDYDVDAQTLHWDDRLLRLYGVDPKDCRTPYALWADHLHVDDRAKTEESIRVALAGGPRYDTEFRIVRGDGEVRHLRAFASVQRDSATGRTHMFGVNFDITERKRIETELMETNKRFAVAAEAAGLGFWENYIATKTVRWDDQMFKIRGGTPIEGNHYAAQFSYVHPEDKERVEQELREAAEGRKKFNCEYRIVLQDGRVKHMKSAASLQGEPGSADARLLGVSFDITERKEIEDVVLQANLRFGLAAEAAELGFWDYDLEAQSLRWDDRMFRLYGVDHHDGPQPYDLWATSLHPDDRARAEEEVLATASGGRKFDTEFRIVRPNGEVRHLRAAATLTRDAKTGAARMFGVNFDITERKITENKLLEANERFALAAEAAGLGFWDFDVETQSSKWDDQMYRLYGLARDAELDVASRRSRRHPDDHTRVDQELRDAAAGLRSFDSEYRIVQPGGRVRHLRGAASLKRGAAGRPVRLLGVSIDVTERKEVLEALEQARDAAESANRAKSDFLAVMSHEIRTPMNGIMGMNGLLLDSKLTRSQRRMTETVRESAESLLTIIDDILDISKLESGKIELECIGFHLPELIDKIVDLFTPRARQKSLLLTADTSAVSRAALHGDQARLRQILLNLVSNGIKFTPSGSIAIKVATTDIDSSRTQVRCEVRDTGPGVSEEAKGRLFKPFEQADNSISRRFGGTGLGLSICQRLVKLMDGQIGVTDREGGGSLFWFEVVLLRAPAPIAKVARPAEWVASESAARSGRVLLAEDNAMNIEIARTILERAGFEVDVALDGREAVAAVRQNRYDLVLMDMRMPKLDGIAATREIRASEPEGRRIPIVAMTANAMREDQRRCLEAGMDDYLSKPFQVARLVEMVEHWTGEFQRREAARTATPPTAIDAVPVVDVEASEMLLSCFPRNRFNVLLRRFLRELEQDKDSFPGLARSSALPEMSHEAHKLVASAGHFGARQVQKLAMDLQTACDAGDAASVSALVERLVPASAAAAAALLAKYPLPTRH